MAQARIVKPGVRVRLTVEGVVGEVRPEYDWCTRINVDSGICHYVFLGDDILTVSHGDERHGVKVEVLGPKLVAGKAYQDSDGDVLIRTSEGMWLTAWGATKDDDWAKRPLALLVPEALG